MTRRTSQWNSFFMSAVAVGLGLLLVACGSKGKGGGGGGPSFADLAGTWYGAYQVGSTPHTLAVTLDADGHITDISRDGTSLGLTATIAVEQGASYDIFNLALSDGREGGFMVDAAAMHAGFLTEDGDFGVLQKGATTLPTYALGDINGTWSGYSVGLDSEMNVIEQGPSSVSVTGSDNFSRNLDGTDVNGAFVASVTNPINTTYGYYPGGWQNSSGSGTLRVWLSADKTFGATWACDQSTSRVYSIANCTYAAWGLEVPPPTTAPAAPTGLVATPTSSTSINLTWTDASDNEESFRIERGASSSGPFSEFAAKPAGTTQFTDTGLSAGTTYYYQIRARNSVGDSAYSNVASATTLPLVTTPAAPTGLTATPTTSSSVTLSWTDASDNEESFRIERGASSSGPFSEIATVPTGTTQFSDTGLTAATTYYYRVRARNSVGDSAYSNVAFATTPPSATTVPAAPTSLVATAASTTSINLTWVDNATNETGYKVEHGQVSGNLVLWSEIATPPANATGYTDTSLNPATLYYYRVRATNAAGNSPYSNTANATTLSAGPTIVTLYSAKDAAIVWSDADSRFANTNYGSYASMELGNHFEYGAFVSTYSRTGILVDFAFDPSTWSGKTIASAKLRLYVFDYPLHSTGRYVAYKIVDTLIGGNPQYPWSETGVTWNNAPPYALSPTSTAYAPVNPDEYTEWDVTSIAQGWFTSGTMGNGIAIFDMNPPLNLYFTTNQVTNYYSRQYSVQGLRPRLIINY